MLVNVDNDTLRKIFGSEAAMAAVMNIEGFRALGSSIFETVVDKAEAVKETKKKAGDDLPPKLKKELSDEEKEYKGTRKHYSRRHHEARARAFHGGHGPLRRGLQPARLPRGL